MISSNSLIQTEEVVVRCRVQTRVLARDSPVRLCVLAPHLEQAREAREGSQWDQIKVDQV
jgi:hypothetical protein